MFTELSSLEDGLILNKGFSGRVFRVDRLPLFTMEVTFRVLFFTHCQFSLTHSIDYFFLFIKVKHNNYKGKSYHFQEYK